MLIKQMEGIIKDSIHSDTTVGDAIAAFRIASAECLMVFDQKGNLLGLLTKDFIMNCYLENIPLSDTVGRHASDDYIPVKDTADITDINIMQDDCYFVVFDQESHAKGVLKRSHFLESFISLLSREAIQGESVELGGIYYNRKDTQEFTIGQLLVYVRGLKASIKEVNKIIEFSPDSIYVTDGQGKALIVNNAFEKITGIKRSQVLGRTGEELESEGIFSPSISPIIMKEKRGVVIIQELKESKKALVTGVPIFDENGDIFRIILNSKCIEDSKELKEYFLKREYIHSDNHNEVALASDAEIVYESEHLKSIVDLIKKMASFDSTILITGESGVGKSLLVNIIHKKSIRNKNRLIVINCGAIPEALMESELFGYEAGAFTGAKRNGKPGLIEMANQGTLFLDEIGAMPLNLQIKLLQVIQDRKIVRVGGTSPIDIDVHIIAATNSDLKKLVQKGDFREDLFYRLNVVPINILPVRERREDIVPIAKYFIREYTLKHKKNVIFSCDALEEMRRHNWFGNAREIENFVERMIVTNYSGTVNSVDVLHNLMEEDTLTQQAVVVNRLMPLKNAIKEVEQMLIVMTYKKYPNTYKTAEVLGISQSSAQRKIKEYVTCDKKGQDG